MGGGGGERGEGGQPTFVCEDTHGDSPLGRGTHPTQDTPQAPGEGGDTQTQMGSEGPTTGTHSRAHELAHAGCGGGGACSHAPDPVCQCVLCSLLTIITALDICDNTPPRPLSIRTVLPRSIEVGGSPEPDI